MTFKSIANIQFFKLVIVSHNPYLDINNPPNYDLSGLDHLCNPQHPNLGNIKFNLETIVSSYNSAHLSLYRIICLV